MIIINNSCAGGYLLRDLFKIEYNNPFIWCSMPVREIIKCINNFDKINWLNIEVKLYENRTFKVKCVNIIVDNCFTITYPHYIYKNIETKKEGINVFSKDIIEYAKEKYIKRVNRMLNSNEKVCFIIGGTWKDQIPPNDIMNYITNKNVLVLPLVNQNIKHDNYKFAKWIYETKLKDLQF